MKIVNNFKLIRDHLVFDDPDLFYLILISKRRKENPDLLTNHLDLAQYIIYSMDQFDSKVDEIVEICNKNSARAYIYLNRRSSKKIAFAMLKRVADRIEVGDFSLVATDYQKLCKEIGGEPDKTWVVDIDLPSAPAIEKSIEQLQLEVGNTPLMIKVPTINGYHIISRPFNLSKFNNIWKIDIQKGGPTLLYYGQI
jgi:hypothetical protein